MSEPKRYSFWGMIVHLPGGGVRPEVHFKIDEDGLFVAYPDYEKLKADLEKSDGVVFTQAVENERLKAEVERLQHQIKYWQVEAQTDNDRWLRCLEENERLRKAGDAMVQLLCHMDVVMDMDSDHPEVEAWNAAKEGRPNE